MYVTCMYVNTNCVGVRECFIPVVNLCTSCVCMYTVASGPLFKGLIHQGKTAPSG